MDELAIQIREKRAQLEALEAQADLLRRELDAARAALGVAEAKASGRNKKPPKERRRPINPASAAGLALAALKRVGYPLRVDKLQAEMEAIGAGKKFDRDGLIGQLALYVRRHDTFTRPEPSTYGLIEWGPAQRDPGRKPVQAVSDRQAAEGGT